MDRGRDRRRRHLGPGRRGASQLWISLTLCATFAMYGLLRKIVAADAVTGLGVETGLLFPFAIGWLAWRASAALAIMGTNTTDTVCF